MARIRNFEPSGQDGLKTFRFLISDFSRFQEFLLELGVLLGDLLRHLPPLRFQAPGQGLVLHRQDLGGQHGGVLGAAADGVRSLERAPCPALQLLARLS